MKTLCLIDGDIVLYQCCSAVERSVHWGGDWWTLHSDAREAKMMVDVMLAELKDAVGGVKILVCLSDSENWRKGILPHYKANRSGTRKPLCYPEVKDYVMRQYEVMIEPGLEADDCVALVATGTKARKRGCPRVVMISEDKDFRSVPGLLYNPRSRQMVSTSLKEAELFHLTQTLTGDPTDNYRGCPGIGPARALEALTADPSWSTVVRLYEKAGLTEADALIQARVARLLQGREYNFKTKEVRLWTPTSSSSRTRGRGKSSTPEAAGTPGSARVDSTSCPPS